MRIRFVTRAQLQVLQASRMERHTMWDGIIPLSGLSPSAVSRQWGTTNKSQSYTAFPIAYTKFAIKCYSPTNPNEYSGVIITTSNNSQDISLTGINVDPSTYGRDYFTFGV